jgi:hypothetical protein
LVVARLRPYCVCLSVRRAFKRPRTNAEYVASRNLIPAVQASLLKLDDCFVENQGTKTGVLKLEVADAAAVVLPLPGAALPFVYCVGTLKLCAMFIAGVEDAPNIPGIRKMHEQLEEAQVELRLLQEELLPTRDAIRSRSVVDKLAAVDLSHAWRSVCRSATWGAPTSLTPSLWERAVTGRALPGGLTWALRGMAQVPPGRIRAVPGDAASCRSQN